MSMDLILDMVPGTHVQIQVRVREFPGIQWSVSFVGVVTTGFHTYLGVVQVMTPAGALFSARPHEIVGILP